MSIYFITGKLGNGKTLAGIHHIREHLLRGCAVATNIDIDLAEMVGANKRKTLVYRLKDKPTIQDLEAIGDAYQDKYQKYNEKKFGGLFFDECATWFNSRDWNDKDRQDLINALVHIRKMHWNVYFIVQNISVVDKQARELLGEHTVYMRRTDNMSIPIFSTLIKLLTGGLRIKPPKAFVGIVKYGTSINSLTVDTWFFRLGRLYKMYNTEQIFSQVYDCEAYCMLPPWYTKGQFLTKKNRRYYMKITKIYLKKYSRFLLLAVGVLVGGLTSSYASYSLFDNKLKKAVSEIKENKKVKSEDVLPLKNENIESAYLKYFKNYDVRLLSHSYILGKLRGSIEFYDSQDIYKRLTFVELALDGWSIKIFDRVVTFSKHGDTYHARHQITRHSSKELLSNVINNEKDILKMQK